MRTFTVGVRFHSAGCTEATAKPTTSAVKISMAARLLNTRRAHDPYWYLGQAGTIPNHHAQMSYC